MSITNSYDIAPERYLVDVLGFSHYSSKNVFEEQIQLVSLAIILWDVWVFQFVAITVRLNNQTTRK